MAGNPVYPASATFLYEAGDRHQSLTRDRGPSVDVIETGKVGELGVERSGWGGPIDRG